MKTKLLIFSMIFLILFTACSSKTNTEETSTEETTSIPDGISGATFDRYRENEIMEYKGARLDPAIGPRDNSITGVQYVEIDGYTLKIDGLVDKPQELSYDEILDMEAYERKITLYCVEGWDATILWKGVLLKELIDKAGAQEGAVTVIFHAVDGYTTSLPLETIVSKQLIMAYGANEIDLPPEMGYPFIVVAEDKFGYKWARWVTEIELSDDPDYKGYWEQLGFSNDADLE